MGFFSIVPRDKKYLNYSVGSIPLKVIQNDGIDAKPHVDIKVTDLNGGQKHFLNNSHTGGSFTVNVLLNQDDTVEGVTYVDNPSTMYTDSAGRGIIHSGSPGELYSRLMVIEILDYIIRNMIPVYVYTEAIDVANSGLYIITANGSRKQTYKKTTVWELEFTTYTPLNLFKYVNDNSAVKSAIAKNKKKTTNSASTNKSKLKKCNYKTLKYSKKKKVVKCVKYMQNILKSNKCYSGKIDGWFGKDTAKAVKKFQKKNKKKYKLKATGKVDKATWKALCK